MADDAPSLHVDTDWKKQAQEEKRRLAEQQVAAKPKEPLTVPGPGGAAVSSGPSTAAATSSSGRAAAGRDRGPVPVASFPRPGSIAGHADPSVSGRAGNPRIGR